MPPRKPDLLFVLADDLGYGDLSSFNDGRSETPALDQPASLVWSPARASLLTGRHPHRTGAIDTLEGRDLDRIALDETTIAALDRVLG